MNIDQFPTLPEGFLTFENYEIYGFVLKSYPSIEGLIATQKENNTYMTYPVCINQC